MGRDDAPLTPHRQPAVQCYQDLHHRSGVAGTIRSRQQLQGMQLEPYCIVLGHLSAVLETQDLFQAQLRIQWEECSLRVLRRYLEALVEPGQELRQHVVGLFNGACPGQPEFRYQPVLKGTRNPLHATLAWGDRAKIICIPSSSIALLNWVDVPARLDPGVCRKTPCRSV